VADVNGLPVSATSGTAIQFGLRGVPAPSAAEDAVGAFFVRPTQPALV
jgi:hypothetical protein